MRNTIRWKTMGYFLLTALIMCVCLEIFYQVTIENVARMASDSMENVLEKINLDTYNKLHEVQEIAYLISRDREIQTALRSDLPQNTRELYSQRLSFNDELSYINRYAKGLYGIYVFGENGACFRSTFRSMLLRDFREDDWYREVKETQEPLWVCQDEGSVIVRDIDAFVISISVPIIDRASYRFLGVTVVELLMENLHQISQEGMVFDGTLLLLDENDDILYTDREEEIDADQMGSLKRELRESMAQEPRRRGLLRNRGYLFRSIPLDIGGWKIAAMIPYAKVYEDIWRIRNLMLGVSAVCVLLCVVMAVSIYRGISRPLLAIRTAMRKVERGNLEAHAEVRGKDEMAELAQSFNRMVDRLNVLVKGQKESQEKLRMAELQALQAQINPHFLYNTLDSINWMARAGKVKEVTEVVDSLSTFFRISLSGGRTFITVDEELCHVENYILIQKKRYEKYLDYEIDVPEEIRKYQCLKMILQPLVENSIYHGLKEKREKGMIRITAELVKGTLLFHVADSGQGMTREKLQELQQMMRQGSGYEEYDQRGYGVINVQRRIQTYFGRGYGLHFRSEWGRGTEVTVALPARREREEQDVEGGTD